MSRLTLIIIFIALSFLIIFFLLRPRYQDLSNLNLEITNKKTELQYIEEHFSEINKLLDKLENYKEELEKINFALPSDGSLSLLSLLRFLVTASSQTGLRYETLGTYSITVPQVTITKAEGPHTEEPQFGIASEATTIETKTISVNFSVSGRYTDFKKFLEKLEQSARIIEVEKVNFEFEQFEGEGTPIFSFNVQIKTHFH